MIEAASGGDAVFAGAEFDVEALVDFMQRRAQHYGALCLPDQPAPSLAVARDDSPATPQRAPLLALLDLFAQHLDALHTNVAVLEEWMRSATEQNAQSGQRMAVRVDELTAALGALDVRLDNLDAQLANVERRISHDLAEIQSCVVDTLNTRLAALEHKVSRELDEMRQSVQDDFAGLEGRLRDRAHGAAVLRLSPLIVDGHRRGDGGGVGPIGYELE